MIDLLTAYLSPSDAATALKRTERTLERWRRLRTGPTFYVIQGRPKYKAEDLKVWIESDKRDPLPKVSS